MTNSSTGKQTRLSTGEHLSTGVRPYVGVGLGVTISSTAAILIRLAQAEAPSLVIAAWRLALATLILAPVTLVLRRSELRALTRPGTGGRAWVSALASGLLLAIHFATWISSLAYTSVAASAVLVSAYPIFVGLASHLLLHERLSREMIVGLVAAMAGSVLIGLGDLGESPHRLLGDALALTGAIAGAGYFLIGRRLRARLSLLAYVFPVYGTAAVALMVATLVSGLPAIPHRPQTWACLLLMALGPQILGHSSLNWALRYLSATYVTIAALGEPIGSTLLAWWLLGERPSLWAVAGGVLTLAGIAVASHAEAPDSVDEHTHLPIRHNRATIGKSPTEQEDKPMQVRCQRCGTMLTLSREAIAAALEEAEQTQARHYAVNCPKCRHQIKVPIKDMERFRPRESPPQ